MPGDIKGLKQATAAFKALPDATRDRIGEATRVTVSEIARVAAAHAPQRYGFLRKHIGFSFSAKTGRGKAGITPGVERLPNGRLVSPAKYAHFSEFGSRHQSAQPFLIPAAEAEQSAYLERARRAGQDVERDLAAIGGGRL